MSHAVGILTGHRATQAAVQRQSKCCLRGPVAPSARIAVCSHRRGKRHVAAAVFPGEPGSWGEQIRPDTCNMDDVDRPGPLSDIDQEWQAFVSGRGRYTQPQPLMWDQDSINSSSWPPSSPGNGVSNVPGADGSDGGSNVSTSNRGPEASCSSRYTSSIQSFDDWDMAEGDYALPVPFSMQPLNEALPMTSSSNANSSSSNPAAAAAASIHSLASGTSLEGLWAAAMQPTRDVASPADLLGSRGLWQDMREVYVLLFGVGQKDTEGIYSLRAVSEDGLPTETIIAFEDMDDAVRYAALLEATMEHSPSVCSIPPAELMAFCSDSGYRCRLELQGSLLMPPEYNVHVTDWERSLRLREGKFHVLQDEPEVTTADAIDSALSFLGMHPGMNMGGMNLASMSGYSLSRDSPFNTQPAEFSASELDTVKAQLEALLPASSSDDDDNVAGS